MNLCLNATHVAVVRNNPDLQKPWSFLHSAGLSYYTVRGDFCGHSDFTVFPIIRSICLRRNRVVLIVSIGVDVYHRGLRLIDLVILYFDPGFLLRHCCLIGCPTIAFIRSFLKYLLLYCGENARDVA